MKPVILLLVLLTSVSDASEFVITKGAGLNAFAKIAVAPGPLRNKEEQLKFETGMAYLSGYLDACQSGLQCGARFPFRFPANPAPAKLILLASVIQRHLAEHPEQLKLSSREILESAFTKAFPAE
ncbi:MAG: hypothetical protein JWL59_1289 [Chthoniobacteraceae bacterium]|nr:hypothetical protein [Chthoniobacteraceae bacterium]